MKLKNLLLRNYIMVFIITSVIAILLVMMLNMISSTIEKSLVKNKYTAQSMMHDDIKDIDYDLIIKNHGGLQVVDKNYKVILSKGIDVFSKKKLTVPEFTEFLVHSQSIDREYSYSIAYNEKNEFWLIVTFPTSLRIDFNITRNKLYMSSDSGKVYAIIIIIFAAYLVILIISTLIYIRFTAIAITNPLARIKSSVNQFRKGDYTIRTNLLSGNEIGDLGQSFDDMAKRIQTEISLREKTEQDRRQFTLDIAHDLKNPFASIMGYAEYCIHNPSADISKYLNIIYQKSSSVNQLVNRLFELTKLESPGFSLNKSSLDFAEYLRMKCADYISLLEVAEFEYGFDIPEEEIIIEFDRKEMDRVFDNIFENSIRYNQCGTKITLSLTDRTDHIMIFIEDNGVGISKEQSINIFQPFVRADASRNSETGGNGLGLAIVYKIIKLHQGEIELETDIEKGVKFIIKLPR